MNAIALWLFLAFSLGWYYTFTYYGRSGWPMPTLESGGGIILYYFSVLNVRTELQALHWMLVFPVCGILWAAFLSLTAPAYGARNENFAQSLLSFALTTLPLSLPGIYMAYVAGGARRGWSVGTMVDVALRRANVSSWGWLSYMYFGLACAALAWHVYVYRKTFPMPGRAAWRHFLLTAILYFVFLVGLGTVVSIPLRAWLTPNELGFSLPW